MPKWRFGQEIGSGGYGRVFEAARVEVDGKATAGFALKFLLDEHLSNDEAVARFKREVRLVREQLNHPNVLQIVDAGVDSSPPWFVMPRASSNLHQEIAAGRGQDEEWVVLVFRQILAGVAHAHAEGVLHRDLKPDNVLFVNGVPQISDFGLGKRLASASTTLTGSHMGLGTLAYMAPEQWGNSANADCRADVYALGKILCEMFNGRVPEPFIHDTKGVPVKFRYFVDRCCEREPDRRYADAGEALAAFTKLIGEVEVVQPAKDRAIALINDWEGLPSDDDWQAIEAFDEHLRKHQDDEGLYREVVPRLPRVMTRQYMASLPAGFSTVLRAYDAHLDGGLPFDYCDTVADFYKFVWAETDDQSLRRLLLSRLINMGASHNRWHVGGVVRDIFVEIKDPGTASLAADVIRADPDHALWFASYLENQPIPKAVAEAMAEARSPAPTPMTDDIPL